MVACHPRAGLPGYNSPGEAAMFELPAVQAVVQPVPAAHSLALCCTQCFTLLLGCGKELPLQALHAVLAALALQQAQPAAAEAPTKQQVCADVQAIHRHNTGSRMHVLWQLNDLMHVGCAMCKAPGHNSDVCCLFCCRCTNRSSLPSRLAGSCPAGLVVTAACSWSCPCCPCFKASRAWGLTKACLQTR